MPSTITSALPPYTFRVCYSDTDAAGFVHHARYLEIFERSRTEWLHQIGLSPARLVNEFGILLPIREINLHFHKPGRLDDLLRIDQEVTHHGRTQAIVKQTATRIHQDHSDVANELIASAVIHIVCVDTTSLKPKALPDWLFPLPK